ncbi:hypothetical protein [Geminicoccus flavidas]|uniref:hypothetical protein n=1 Tax=Geminicoccus flavidas TaxID=2506407 RepID=UPI001359C54D|nr:hypothetical protein [Geminicoccus flavidas]
MFQLLGHQVDDLALLLYPAQDLKHPAAKDDAAIALEHRQPHHQAGDAVLILDGEEQNAAGRAQALADQAGHG